jgi:hypothetical protein
VRTEVVHPGAQLGMPEQWHRLPMLAPSAVKRSFQETFHG